MEIWFPAVLALLGALAGVLLTNALSRSTRRQEARRSRLEEALRSVVLAISARHFATRAGFNGAPTSVTSEHVEELERRIYLSNVERMFVTLRDARQAVAVLVADGVPVGDSWRGDEEMQADLERVYAVLLGEMNSRPRIARRLPY